MSNYPYIIAGFPDLLLEFGKYPVDPASVVAEVKGQLSEEDCTLVDWLVFGLDGSHLTPHFYRKIRQTRCRFLKEWFAFDRKVRLAKVAYLEDRPVEDDFPECEKAVRIFERHDLLDREKQLDRLYWDKASELVDFDIFDIDVILSLLVRLHIAARWNKLDQETGKRLLKQLVEEVTGTFKGINAEQI